MERNAVCRRTETNAEVGSGNADLGKETEKEEGMLRLAVRNTKLPHGMLNQFNAK